ncbi:MAG: DMT family transporter [Pseudomonadota bacterium]
MTWLIAGAVTISFAPILVKVSDVSPTVSAFYRMLFGGGVLLFFFLVTAAWHLPRLQVVLGMVLAGGFFAIDLFFWHRSILLIGPGLATLLAGFQVFVMAFVAATFFSERLTTTVVLMVLLAFVGVGLIVSPTIEQTDKNFLLGVTYGLITAFAFAGVLLTLKFTKRQSVDHKSALLEVVLVSLSAAVFLAILSWFNDESLVLANRNQLMVLFAYGLVAQIGWVMVNRGVTGVTAIVVGLGLLLEPVLALLWEALFFGMSHTPIQLAGAALAMMAIFVVAKGRRAP